MQYASSLAAVALLLTAGSCTEGDTTNSTTAEITIFFMASPLVWPKWPGPRRPSSGIRAGARRFYPASVTPSCNELPWTLAMRRISRRSS